MAVGASALLTVPQPGDLLRRYYPNGRLGGLALDGEPPAPLATKLRVVVRVTKPAQEFSFRGQLAWARHKAPRQPPSYGIDFLPEDQPNRLRLMAFARSELPESALRLERRLQVELPVRVTVGQTVSRELLADLSTGGAFVKMRKPVALGEVVKLSFRPPRSLGTLVLRGQVVWVRDRGDEPGLGVEFLPDLAARTRLERLLTRLGPGAGS
jgi:Tfp pilus assembly protein PilZ